MTQQVPAGATINATRFQRALPGGGTAAGSCTVADRTVTCTTDGALVEPTTVAAQRWVLEVDLFTAAPGEVEILHTVSSPHPEPVPDPGPNTATSSSFFVSNGIIFEAVPPVSVGEVFDVSGVAVTGFPVPANFVSVSLPPNLEAVSVTMDGQTTPCQPSGSCTSLPFGGVANGSTVSMRLRAVNPGPPAGVTLSISTIGFTVAGQATVQVVDPSITSEVHPELDSVVEGIVGVSQTLRGTVWNTGSSDHAEVTATIELPTSLQVDDARWGVAGLPCSVSGSTVTCAVGEVPAHASVAVTVRATPSVPGPVTVTMSTVTSEAQDDPDPVADTDSVTLRGPARLRRPGPHPVRDSHPSRGGRLVAGRPHDPQPRDHPRHRDTSGGDPAGRCRHHHGVRDRAPARGLDRVHS